MLFILMIPGPAFSTAATTDAGPTLMPLLSAVIAAMVALAVAGMTRTREHEKWLRERIFDATKSLISHRRQLLKAILDVPQMRVNEHFNQESVEETLNRFQWDGLIAARDGYIKTLDEVLLLAPTAQIEVRTIYTIETIWNLFDIMRYPYPNTPQVIFPDSFDFNNRHINSLKEFNENHDAIVTLLRDDFLAFKHNPLHAAWVKSQVMRRFRRRENQERVTQIISTRFPRPPHADDRRPRGPYR